MAHSPAYDKYPEHTLTFDSAPVAVRVSIEGVVVAETKRAKTLREGKYPATVYLPREDVNFARLSPTDHSTHCPFKGDASYFDFTDAAKSAIATEQVAWSYEDPFDQMNEIRNYLSFYADRTTIEILEA